MTPEAQRIAIAEACGWTSCFSGTGNEGYWQDQLYGINPKWNRWPQPLPDYCNDLNAIEGAEEWLFTSMPGYYERAWYGALVFVVTGIDPYERGWGDVDTRQHSDSSRATAADRSKAFLRTIGKWVEG